MNINRIKQMAQDAINTTNGNRSVSGQRGARTNGKFEFYVKLCKQKGKSPEETALYMTQAQMQIEIDKLLALPDVKPMSPKQREMIINKSEELGVPLPKNLEELTGGSQGTASQYIETLFEMEKKMEVYLPITDWQMERLAEMYMCPQVFFDELDERYAPTPVETAHGTGWKKPFNTVEELLIDVYANHKRKTVKEFIQKYDTEYKAWKVTRISEQKMNFINNLIKQQAGEEGMMSKYDLLQFDDESANEFITKLQIENAKIPRTIGEQGAVDIERQAKTAQEATEALHNELEAFGNQLLAIFGESGRIDDTMDATNLIDILVMRSQMGVIGGFIDEKSFIELVNETITDAPTVTLIIESTFPDGVSSDEDGPF